MRNTKKVISILLTLLMVVGMMSTFAFAAGSGSIKIENASIGETYEAYKIFNAKVAANGGITYQELTDGQIAGSKELSSVFEVESTSNDIKVKTDVTDEAVVAAVKAYIDAANLSAATPATPASSNVVEITGLEYGYYYVKSSLGAVVSITSTKPQGVIKDKNAAGPTNLVKKVNGIKEANVNIGDTVTYTVTFEASNFVNAANSEEGKKVSKYIITDTLPNFLSDVTVTSLKIGSTTVDPVPSFTDKKIEIPWVSNGTSLYDNKTNVELTYTAKVVKNDIVYDGAGNTNTVMLTWDYVTGTPTATDKLEDTAKIYTYAIALKKINSEGTSLSGAEFKIPFNATEESTGVYVIDNSETGETTVSCDSNGIVIIKGVDLTAFNITETKAPDGYNLLKDSQSIAAEKTSNTSTNWSWNENADIKYINEDISVKVFPIINYTGTELPSTGGIGTTIFYLIGAILVIGAGVVFVTRRRMHSEK